MSNQVDAERYRANLYDEWDSAMLYGQLARAESDPNLSQIYQQLSETESRHATFWEERLRSIGAEVPSHRTTWRARTLGWIARRFGPGAVLPTLLGQERKAGGQYDSQPEVQGTAMPAQERSHARTFQRLMTKGGLSGPAIAQFEGRHRAAGGNALRAAVLGANDGLVSNLSLVMGVAGATVENATILLAGFAGLLARALSMALGEWLSVQSARELFQRQLAVERSELEESPEEEREELALIYQAKGIPADQARELADRIIASPESALDTLAREELGIDPEELGGSAWVAAATSFVLFAIGAIIPVLGFLFTSGTSAVLLSGVLSAVGLFAIGAGITLFTGRSIFYSGFRQVLFGLVAAVITFGLGKLAGAALG